MIGSLMDVGLNVKALDAAKGLFTLYILSQTHTRDFFEKSLIVFLIDSYDRNRFYTGTHKFKLEFVRFIVRLDAIFLNTN